MRRAVALAMTLAMVGFSGLSCSEAKLEPIPKPPQYRDDKISVAGEYCTSTPETLVFPLRVLFVIDSSISMEVTDPPDPVTGQTGRERAVEQVWTDLLEQSPEATRIGIVRFSAQAQSRTARDLDGDSLPDTYFTADRQELEAGTQALGITDRTTNYINALGEAYFELRTEMIAAEKESLPLSKYVVVFLSDGIPDVDSDSQRGNTRQEILESVQSMQKLAKDFRVGSFEFHTAYLASGTAAFDEEAKGLLEDMSREGDGTFRSFPNGEALNFLFVDFTVLKRVFTLKTLSAINLNAVLDQNQIPKPPEPVEEMPMMEGDMGEMMVGAPEPPAPPSPLMFVDLNESKTIDCGEPLADSDADGLSDLVEIEIGTNPLSQDTDDDGLSDYLEWQFQSSNLDPLDPEDSSCYIPSPCVDGDMDGLCDCLLDFDVDGVCDCADPPQACRNTPSDPPDCVNYDPIPPGQCQDVTNNRDCVDLDMDGLCDCPDINQDGLCDYEDRDLDGLHDCEEIFYGSAQNGTDTDADGIPDLSEVRLRTNPALEDMKGDLDADRTPNGTELLSNTDPLCDDSALRSRIAYRYQLEEKPLTGTQTCYDFDIRNITLVPTIEPPAELNLSGPYPGRGWNRVLLYAGEVAFDDPDAFANYRIACVMASYLPDGNFKNPPSGRVQLTKENFVPAREFDPNIHCIYPDTPR